MVFPLLPNLVYMLDRISVVIICKNSAVTLQKSLESTQDFDEVVIYDNGSEDDTMVIASNFPNVSLHQGSFEGFGPTKNHAVSLARHDWVFSLDSDESITGELIDFLRSWKPESNHTAGFVLRKNFFMGRYVKHGGWGNDWLLRVFNRTTHQFDDALVHEKVLASKGTFEQKLSGAIDHNAVQDIGQFLVKVNRYTEISRRQKKKTFHPAIILLRSLFAFIRSYFIRAGFIDGWRGLVIAWNEANGVFYKYMKRYVDIATEREKNQSTKIR
jgi:glycosyltransferase involved in cell wall biosynthesis